MGGHLSDIINLDLTIRQINKCDFSGHCHNYSLVFKNYVVEQKKSEDGWNGTYPMLYEMAKVG